MTQTEITLMRWSILLLGVAVILLSIRVISL